MPGRVPLLNFSKGELAEQLLSRFDVPAYQGGLRRARNVTVLKYGGITRRPGTQFVAQAAKSGTVRLIPFQFNLEQTYALEMGQGYMRPLTGGGVILEAELAITGISNAGQAVVTVPFHGLSVGDQWFMVGIAGMTALNHRVVNVVAIIDANRFKIDVDTSLMPAFAGATGGITRTAPPDPPAPDPEVPPPVVPPVPPPTGGGGGTHRPTRWPFNGDPSDYEPEP